jgi:hypothetical protein
MESPRYRRDGFVISTDKSRLMYDLPAARRVEPMQLHAHELYRRYGGFAPLAAPEMWMERVHEKR